MRFSPSHFLALWPTLIGLASVPFSLTARADVPRLPAGLSAPLMAPAMSQSMPPGLQCRRAIQAAARQAGIPDHLMAAIARVESGRRGADGQVQPWPWTINAEGTDHVYDTKDAAIAGVRAFQALGMRSIDVGCMQVNLMHHPNAFASLDMAFDPTANAVYAASFLAGLFQQTGSWPRATAAYHSATPQLGNAYQQKVMAVLAEETQADITLLGPPVRMSSNGVGAIMLSNHADAARILPMATNAQARGLDAYRAAPVRVAGR